MVGQFDYFRILKYINGLRESFPFVGTSLIGKSVMGKDITALTIGGADEYVLFVGGLRGNEQTTSLLLLHFFRDLCTAIAENKSIEGLNARRAMCGRALTIIPCINPDGCEISSKGKVGSGNYEKLISRLTEGSYKGYSLNARGVDITLDFSDEKSTEPETVSVKGFVEATPIRHVLELGIGQNTIATPKSSLVRKDKMLEIMKASSGFDFETISEGFSDWFESNRKKPAFRVAPQLYEEAIDTYNQIRELLMLTAIM